MEYIQQVIAEYKGSMKQMFKLRQEELYNQPMIGLSSFHDAYENATRPELYNFNLAQKPSGSSQKGSKK